MAAMATSKYVILLMTLLPAIAICSESTSTAECLERCGSEADRFGQSIVENEIVTASLYLDNDLFTTGHHDKDYTGGFAIAFSGAKAAKHPFSIDKALGLFNRLTFDKMDHSVGDFSLNSCEAGVTAFTPADISNPLPALNDRPYASLLYLSNSRQDINLKARRSWVSTLTVGAIGLKVTGDIQNAIHQVTGSNEAAGWDNQISAGGEPTFRYNITRLTHFDTGTPNLQITGAAGGGIGYLTDLSTGLSIRYGRLRTPWWNQDEDSGKYGAKAHPELPASRRLDEIYLIAGVNVQARVYNAFLQGQFRESEVSYSADRIRPWVFESWIGGACEWSSGFRLSYIIRHQSSEIRGGDGDRSYNYGALITTFRF